MTPIQEAMCRVIRECGFEGLDKVKKNSLTIDREVIPDGVNDFGYVTHRPGGWTITLDGHMLTQREYNEWLATQRNNR